MLWAYGGGQKTLMQSALIVNGSNVYSFFHNTVKKELHKELCKWVLPTEGNSAGKKRTQEEDSTIYIKNIQQQKSR